MPRYIYEQVKTSPKWSLVIFRLLVPWKEKNSDLCLSLSCVCYQPLFLLWTVVQWGGLGFLFCFIMPSKLMWAMCCAGKEGREAQFLAGKGRPYLDTSYNRHCCPSYIQFKFWLFLFQCPSNTDVTGRKVWTWVHFCDDKTWWGGSNSEDSPWVQRSLTCLFLDNLLCFVNWSQKTPCLGPVSFRRMVSWILWWKDMN